MILNIYLSLAASIAVILFMSCIGNPEYLLSSGIVIVSLTTLYFMVKLNKDLDECNKACENVIETCKVREEIKFKAYLIAEQDGFKKHPDEYWAQAELIIKNNG
jgi:Zn-dependent membrane protease YugP